MSFSLLKNLPYRVFKTSYRKLKRSFLPRVDLNSFERFLDYVNLPASIYITSSFSSLGNCLFSPTQLLHTLLEYLGHSGTISAPAHLDPFGKSATSIGDLRLSDFHTGVIPTALFNLPDTKRSSHPFASTLSYGLHSQSIAHERHKCPYLMDTDSSFIQLSSLNTLILGIGVDFSAHAFMHLVEDQTNYPLNVYESIPHVFRFFTMDGTLVKAPYYRYNKHLSKYRVEKMTSSYYHSQIYEYLQLTNSLRFFLLGDALCWSIPVPLLMYRLQELLSQGLTIYGKLDEPYLQPFLR